MPALILGIHVLFRQTPLKGEWPDKPGHDDRSSGYFTTAAV